MENDVSHIKIQLVDKIMSLVNHYGTEIAESAFKERDREQKLIAIDYAWETWNKIQSKVFMLAFANEETLKNVNSNMDKPNKRQTLRGSSR